MNWSLIEEDILYKEETTYTDPYTLRGVYYEGEETLSYKPIEGTHEPFREGESGLVLPAGTSASDAKMLYSSEQLLGYEDSGQIGLADKVFLSDPETGKTKPQRYVVMTRELWPTNSGFKLITTDNANAYMLIKEEKAVPNGI